MGLKSMFRSLMLGAGAGAAVVYFNDPERGEERREQFMRKASAKAEDAKGMIEQAKSEVAERSDDSGSGMSGDKAGSGMGTSSSSMGSSSGSSSSGSMGGTTGSGMGSSSGSGTGSSGSSSSGSLGGTTGSGMGTSGSSDTVDLTGDKPLGSSTLPADDLKVPGDRSM